MTRPWRTVAWKRMTLEERLFGRTITLPNGCWEWQGHRDKGYGVLRYDGRDQKAHRVSYMVRVGPIPDGYQIDHLCRNRACINPAHLEPVTRPENIRRGRPYHPLAQRTHCKYGHPFEDHNLPRRITAADGTVRVIQCCGLCRNEQQNKRRRAARKASEDTWR